jgi:hypothetical protein
MMPFYLRQSYDTCLSILESGEPKSSFIGRQVMTVLPGWGSLEVADLDERRRRIRRRRRRRRKKERGTQ